MTKTKSAAQLDAEIAEALATPKHGAKITSAPAAPRATRATVTRVAVAKFGPGVERGTCRDRDVMLGSSSLLRAALTRHDGSPPVSVCRRT
jgi:hypothetical protein